MMKAGLSRLIGPAPGSAAAPSSSQTRTGKDTRQAAKKSNGAWARTAKAPARKATDERRQPPSNMILPARRSIRPARRESPDKPYSIIPRQGGRLLPPGRLRSTVALRPAYRLFVPPCRRRGTAPALGGAARLDDPHPLDAPRIGVEHVELEAGDGLHHLAACRDASQG